MGVDVSDLAIERETAEAGTRDVLEGASRWTVKVHRHGFIALLDVMPRLAPEGRTADYAIVQAARVSYGEGTKHVREDRGLIRVGVSRRGRRRRRDDDRAKTLAMKDAADAPSSSLTVAHRPA